MVKLDTKLAKILALNSGFSIIHAIVMLLLPSKIADILLVPELNIMGLNASMIILILAAGLLIFGLYVGFIAFHLKQYYKSTFDIILADWAWVVSNILIISFAGVMTTVGMVYFAITALIVAAFAGFQYLHYQPSSG